MFLFFVVRTKSKSHVRKKYNSCNFTMRISFTFCTCFQLDEEHFFCQNISRECSTINGSSSSETTQFHHLLRFDFGQLSISRQKIFPYSVNSRRNYHSIVSLSAGQVVKLEQANRYGQFFSVSPLVRPELGTYIWQTAANHCLLIEIYNNTN